MNAGTKYLMDSIAGLVMEVANLRSQNEQQAQQIAELSKPPAPPAPPIEPEAMAMIHDEHGPSQPEPTPVEAM